MFAVGQAAIDLTPPPVKDFAVSAFGADDNKVLLGGILVVIALYAAVVGMLAVRRARLRYVGARDFRLHRLGSGPDQADGHGGICGSHSGGGRGRRVRADLAGPRGGQARLSFGRPVPFGLHPERTDLGQPADPVRPSGPKRPPDPADVAEPTVRAGPAYSVTSLAHPDDQNPSRWPARRWFLISSGAAAAAAALGTLAGRSLINEHNIAAARAAIRFPRPTVPAPPVPAGSNLNITGLSSFVTSDDAFYRVDTALLVPQVDPATWRLRSTGWCNAR